MFEDENEIIDKMKFVRGIDDIFIKRKIFDQSIELVDSYDEPPVIRESQRGDIFYI